MESATQSDRCDKCLVQTVAEAMERDPALEAVKIDRGNHSISLATLGKPAPDVERFVTERIRGLQNDPAELHCCLLDGDSNCDRCVLPADPKVRRRYSVQHSDNTTTIARITCPTAPKFWRWKSLPLPIFVPREIHIEEEEAHLNEWKWQ